jgi:hypothetical protein
VLTGALLLIGVSLSGLARAGASNSATLTLGSTTLTFSLGNPITQPTATATENPVSVQVAWDHASGWTLSVLASNDLTSGSNHIAINQLTWTATGTRFNGGTMSKTTAQQVGSGSGSTGSVSGTLSYSLANSWTYPSGTYSTTLTYTLVAP